MKNVSYRLDEEEQESVEKYITKGMTISAYMKKMAFIGISETVRKSVHLERSIRDDIERLR
jgi:hypothetical protein